MKTPRYRSLFRSLTLLAAGLVAGAANSATAATSVGASFIGRNATPADRLARSESAGVFPQTYWNNVDSGDPPVSGTTAPLLDSTGNFTSVQVYYDVSDSWSSDGPSVTPDEKLMKGIIKANPSPDTGPFGPTNTTDRMVFTATNLPAGTFDVYVYVIENGSTPTAAAQMDLTVGATTFYIQQQADFSANADVFFPGTSTTPGNYSDGNYALFPGVSTAANGTIVITAKKHIVDPQVNDGIGVAGIQLVQVSGGAFGANTATCSITTQPVGTTNLPGATVNFTVGDSGPCRVQWTKNGVNIPGANDESLSFTATLADNGAVINALVYNNVITNKSTDALLGVVVPTLTQGFLTVDQWQNIGATVGAGGLDDLKTNVPGTGVTGTAPSLTYYVAGASVPQTSPNIDSFGDKVSGWVKPDVTGDYNFFIRSDDASELYLNSVNTGSGTNALPDVHTSTAICSTFTAGQGFQEPPSTAATDTPIHLEGGKLYGVVALLKEGTGNDFLQVAWRLTTDTTPAGSLTPIPSANCYTLATPIGQGASITAQPQSVTVFEGRPASFTVAVTTAPAAGLFGMQWLANNTVVPSAQSATYTIPFTTLAQNNTQIKANAFTLVGVLASSVATLTVLPDTNPPVVLAAGAFAGSTQIGVTFDEDLDPVSAANPANYKVNGAAVTSAVVRTNVANEPTNEKNLVSLIVATPITAAFTVSVTGVKDVKGNSSATPVVSQGQLINLTSTDIGSPAGVPGGPDPLFPSTITQWGPGSFDVLCNGNDYWNNADGFNFLYAPRTNSFDVKVRVVSISPIDNWSAGAIEVREGPPTPNGGGWELARHYFCKANASPAGSAPATVSLDGSGAGNNNYEFNCRRAPGDPTLRETSNNGPGQSQGWGGTGPGNVGPTVPNAWIRIARVKNGPSDHLLGYHSADGVEWTLAQDVDLNDAAHSGYLTSGNTNAGPWPDVCYVGLGSTCHTGVGNNNATNAGVNGTFWYSPVDQPYGCYVIYRDWGDFQTSGGTTPTLTSTYAGGILTLTYTGKLYSSDTVNGTFTLISGAANPYTVNPSTSGKRTTFYRAGP